MDFVKKLKPSLRGELEITDINKMYLKQNQLSISIPSNMKWFDVGSFESLLDASNYIRNLQFSSQM